MFISPAFAQTAGAPAGGGFGDMLFLMGSFILIFYFLIIRPQRKRMKQHQAMIESVQRNDTVITAGGLVGKVTKVKEEEIEVEIAEGVRVNVLKSTLSDVRGKGAAEKAPAAKSADKKKAK